MKPNSAYRAALYMRLSKDDDGAGESASIISQRKILRAFAKENGFFVYREYVDDGYSGTNFDRPAFLRMIADIEAKKVDLVLTKDLSRLGREYITTGQYTELYFPSKQVRYIAVNDGYDSESPCADIAPFKNIINEMYARDTSKKIRSAFAARMQEGFFIGNFAPYGYRKDPLDKHHLLIDEQAAPVVKTIFALAAQGSSPTEIARYLNSGGILSPALYRCTVHGTLHTEHALCCREWMSGTIRKLLRNVVYLGHMAQGKTTKVSFKSRQTIQNPRENWVLVENTHAPIVDQQLFALAGRRTYARTCQKSKGFCNLFSGLAKCADCGHSMSAVGTRRKGALADLICGSYKLRGCEVCSNHAIDYQALSCMVLKALQNTLRLTEEEESAMLAALQSRLDSSVRKEPKDSTAEELEKEIHILDTMMEKLYEDRVSGLLQEERFQKLFSRYEDKAQLAAARLKAVQAGATQKFAEKIPVASLAIQNSTGPSQMCAEQQKKEGMQQQAQIELLIKKYSAPEKLDADLLFWMIDRIEIGQGCYQKTENGRRKQQTVKVYFRFSGAPEELQLEL